MTEFLISAHADHRPNSIHLPRTQREAGIDLKIWDSRLSPMRSWCQEIVRAVGVAAVVISLIILCIAVAG